MAVSENAVQDVASRPVPAWKRLGLKLKYAKESPDKARSTTVQQATSFPVADQPVRSTSNGPPSNDEDLDAQAPKAKKRKIDRDATRVAPVESTAQNDNSNTAGPLQAIGQRKSVTFTSDTKAEDGFSATTLFQQWTAQDQVMNGPDVSTPQPTLADTTQTKKPKRKKEKQPKADSTEIEDTTVSDRPETLEYVKYLEQFHTDKPNWKFNKKKQKDLLKNLYNVYRVPPKHHDALIAYIAGLQGAAVQQRLIEGAETVLKSSLERQGRAAEVDGMFQHDRRAIFEKALHRELKTLDEAKSEPDKHTPTEFEEMQQAYERNKRAEAIISELLKKSPPPPPVRPTTVPQSVGSADAQLFQAKLEAQPAPKYTKFAEEEEEGKDDAKSSRAKPPAAKSGRRKRKSRTEVSSSSESSSGSESSNDSSSTDSDSD